MLRRPKIYICARNVISSPHSRTKAIWVPKSLLANFDGPIPRLQPKYAWWAFACIWRWYEASGCLSVLILVFISSYQSYIAYSFKIDREMNLIVICLTSYSSWARSYVVGIKYLPLWWSSKRSTTWRLSKDGNKYVSSSCYFQY